MTPNNIDVCLTAVERNPPGIISSCGQMIRPGWPHTSHLVTWLSRDDLARLPSSLLSGRHSNDKLIGAARLHITLHTHRAFMILNVILMYTTA